VLSGDGADEIFLGYKWHLNSDLGNQKDIYSRRLSSICAFDNKQRKELWKLSEAKNKGFTYSERKYKETNDPISNVTLFDMTSHLPGQILTKIDRAGMMHGLEVRSPFLDTELVQFVFNLPYKYKVNKGEQKYILRDILSEYMPKDFAFRTKQGFGAPIEKWLDEPEMKKFVVNNLGFKANVRKLFSKEAVDKYLGKFYSNKTREKRAAQRIWVLFCLECWLAQNEWTL
jgi:asparagine synthetase B (glutamine-hydrolysing)